MDTEDEQEPERDVVAKVGSLADPSRRALYEFVSQQAEPAGRDEAAAAAGLSRTLAAYHLDRMVEDGLLEASFARRTGRTGPGAGRPAKLYRRAPREFNISLPPRDYELAAQIFADAVESDSSGRAWAALRESAKAFGSKVAAEVDRRAAGRSEARWLKVLEEVLAERGYEPFHDKDGVVRLRNCPFDRLAETHRQTVCGMNLALLEQAAASPKGTRSAVLDPQPGLCCVALVPNDERSKRRRATRN